jgi:hypothetical protein
MAPPHRDHTGRGHKAPQKEVSRPPALSAGRARMAH